MKRTLAVILVLSLLLFPDVAGVCRPRIKKHTTPIENAQYKQLLSEGTPKLIAAAASGLYPIVKERLLKGDDPNARDPLSNMTALMEAAEFDHLDILRLLYNSGGCIYMRDSEGMSVYDHASGSPNILAYLTEKGYGDYGYWYENAGNSSDFKLWVLSQPDLSQSAIGSKVTGKIENASPSVLNYSEIDVNFFDGAGNQIDSTETNTQNLAAGSVWQFEADTLKDNVASFKIVAVKDSSL